MSTFIVRFSISEEVAVEADSKDQATDAVRRAVREGTYDLNIEDLFMHAKSVDEIKRLP